MKIRPVGAESFHVGRQTDMMNLTATFRYFAKSCKKRKKAILNIKLFIKRHERNKE